MSERQPDPWKWWLARARPDNPADADKAELATQILRYLRTTEAREACLPSWAPPPNPFDLDPPPLSDAELDDLPF